MAGAGGSLPKSELEIGGHKISFDSATDVFTFDGFKFAGELLRTLTATPCGDVYRIIERKDGVITISQERDPLAVAAPDMLAALEVALPFVEKLAGFEPTTNAGVGRKLEAQKALTTIRAALSKSKGGE